MGIIVLPRFKRPKLFKDEGGIATCKCRVLRIDAVTIHPMTSRTAGRFYLAGGSIAGDVTGSIRGGIPSGITVSQGGDCCNG